LIQSRTFRIQCHFCVSWTVLVVSVSNFQTRHFGKSLVLLVTLHPAFIICKWQLILMSVNVGVFCNLVDIQLPISAFLSYYTWLIKEIIYNIRNLENCYMQTFFLTILNFVCNSVFHAGNWEILEISKLLDSWQFWIPILHFFLMFHC